MFSSLLRSIFSSLFCSLFSSLVSSFIFFNSSVVCSLVYSAVCSPVFSIVCSLVRVQDGDELRFIGCEDSTHNSRMILSYHDILVPNSLWCSQLPSHAEC